MGRNRINGILYLLSLLGIVLTLHIWFQYAQEGDCWGHAEATPSLLPSGGCTEVLQSEYSKLWGMALPIWGFTFYAVSALLNLAILLYENPKRLRQLRLGLITAMLIFSLYLISIQVFKVQSLCTLCTGSFVLVALLFSFTLWERRLKRLQSGTSSARSTAAIFSLAALLLLLGDLFFVHKVGIAPSASFEKSFREAFAKNLPLYIEDSWLEHFAPCSIDTKTQPVTDWKTYFPQSYPYLGREDAEVIIAKFYDPNCPHCRKSYPLILRLLEKFPSQLKVYLFPVPIWKKSEFQVTAILASNQWRKFYEMIDLQMNQKAFTLETLKEALIRWDIDTVAFMAHLDSAEINLAVQRQKRIYSDALNLKSVPTLLINGAFVRGHFSEKCLTRLVDDALK